MMTRIDESSQNISRQMHLSLLGSTSASIHHNDHPNAIAVKMDDADHYEKTNYNH
jgi:hypothetical protein